MVDKGIEVHPVLLIDHAGKNMSRDPQIAGHVYQCISLFQERAFFFKEFSKKQMLIVIGSLRNGYGELAIGIILLRGSLP